MLRHSGPLIAALGVAAAALIVANFFKYRATIVGGLAEHKDPLSAAASAVNIAAVSVGAVLSYYRFFRGRTFSTRADLGLSVSIIPTPSDTYLHAVYLRIKNIGTLSIWDPRPSLQIRYYGQHPGVETLESWRELEAPGRRRRGLPVVDAGEVASFSAILEVPRSTWAVGYEAFVESSDNALWKESILVANVPSPDLRQMDEYVAATGDEAGSAVAS